MSLGRQRRAAAARLALRFLLSSPETSGDTIFTSQVNTLKRLSLDFVAFTKTFKAVHSGHEQAD